MRYALTGTLTAALTVMTLGLVGCASQSTDNHHASNHPSPAAAPTAPGAQFQVLGTAPAGSEGAGGTAWLARRAGGATVTAKVTGMTPGKKYMSHVHAKPCAQDGGGGHFKFDQGGPEVPPNEIHLTLNTDQSGGTTTSAEVNRDVGPEAKSLVVHDGDKKMLCADF